MKHGSLFSGIGGFDLAAEWMGWENVFHCEWNEFGQRVLKHYWPEAISYGDITKTDFTIHRGTIDVLTGGFPCQPFSLAGKRKGTADDRHLWPEMLRAIKEIQPTWVIGENVSGLVNWDDGLVFEQVQADLEAEGYEVIPFLLPACSVNAPHKRERVWFIAHSTSERYIQRGTGNNRPDKNGPSDGFSEICSQDATDTDSSQRCEGRLHKTKQRKTKRHTGTCDSRDYRSGAWDNFPTQPPVRSRNDGISTRLAGITVSKHRNESIKAYGNAVVPQVVFQIFKAIKKYEKANHYRTH